MKIKLKHNSQPVDAQLDTTSGLIVYAEYSDSGIPLDEVEVLELELNYMDAINEVLEEQLYE